MRVAIVTNIPAPYRIPIYDLLAARDDLELCVFYFAGREPDREWDLTHSKSNQVFLEERYMTFNGRFIHFNPDLWKKLKAFNPDVVVTTGFNPSHLIAFLFAKLHAARHICMTDGTLASEEKLSFLHRLVRRFVFWKSTAFIGASDGSFALFDSYAIPAMSVFKSHLCANNAAFFNSPRVEKRFDFIFCGRFVEIKNPLFAIKVGQLVSKRLGRQVSMLFVGSGDMEATMRTASMESAQDVFCEFSGFARQDELPSLYGSARILLFPTLWDPWGVVANEACAAGLPVLVSDHAGSANELIQNEENGYVLPLQIETWVDAAVRLLTDSDLYQAMSSRSRELVQQYSYENAALGIANAIRVR